MLTFNIYKYIYIYVYVHTDTYRKIRNRSCQNSPDFLPIDNLTFAATSHAGHAIMN